MKISISSESGWYRYPLFGNVDDCLLVLLISLLFSPCRPRTWYRWWIWRSHQPFPIASGLSLELCLKSSNLSVSSDVYSQPLSLEFFYMQFRTFLVQELGASWLEENLVLVDVYLAGNLFRWLDHFVFMFLLCFCMGWKINYGWNVITI